MKDFIKKRLLISLIFILFVFKINAQESYIKLPNTKSSCSTIVVNDNIISNESFIKKNEKLITQMSVMKDKPNRKNHKFYNLSENGIVLVELDKKIKTKSQCDLNKFFGINKRNKVYVNGYLLENSDYEIAIESIVEIELVIPNSTNKLEDKSINIWTVSKEERINGCEK